MPSPERPPFPPRPYPGWPGILLGVLWALAAAAAESDGVRILTAPEVKYMMEHSRVLVINSLSRIEYQIQHIPGSINIPVLEMESTEQLPADKAQALIFYCMGTKCAYSKRAAKKALELGHREVYWFEGGIPEWNRFNYPMQENRELLAIQTQKLGPAEVQALRAQGPVYLLDVRPLWWEESDAALEGSVFIPLMNLDRDYAQIPRDSRIVVVDGAMLQSPSAAKFLVAKGYHVLGVLKGGVLRWEKEGFPVVRKP